MSDEIREHLMEYEESNSLDVEYEIPAKVLPSSLPSFNLVEEVGKISKHLQKLEQKLEEQLSISSSSPLSEGGASFLGGGVSQKNFEAFLGDLFHLMKK